MCQELQLSGVFGSGFILQGTGVLNLNEELRECVWISMWRCFFAFIVLLKVLVPPDYIGVLLEPLTPSNGFSCWTTFLRAWYSAPLSDLPSVYRNAVDEASYG
ncbi:hypothetical protein CHARACLAT_023260 [Characodon lateralis]|uniref:Uncharacterized protein n=1 Tax=Characodon lateralis TaxID=208331 RepID=A0ABU7EZ80_9TELE|nr:hypothetical protein [Characodon lateralis]